MSLPKWSKKDLQYMDGEGYKIVPCENETEALQVKSTLRENGRCAQAGYIVNKENKDIYFVLTKERSKPKKKETN